MFETYRMLGQQHEEALIHEAEKLARGAAVSRGSRNDRGGYRLSAFVPALAQRVSRRSRSIPVSPIARK